MEKQDLKYPISHIRLDLIGILQCAIGYLSWDEIKPSLEHIYPITNNFRESA